MTAISYHDTVNDLHGQSLCGKGPFARLAWFRLLEEAGHSPLLAVARDGDSTVCLPLEASSRRLVSLSNWYTFTWSPLKTGHGSPGLLRAIAGDLARRASRVELTKLDDEDGDATALGRAFREAGWFVRCEACDTNHVLRVERRSFADYFAERPGQLRSTLRRKAGKVEIALSRRFDARDWAAYESIYAQSWKPAEGDPHLLRQFAALESEQGRFLFGLASVGGEPVAAQFWTVDGGAAYIHKLAHREDAAKLSPGTALTAALLEEVIDRDRVNIVDFGTGDDGYKRDWMNDCRPRYRLTCIRPGNPRNWPSIAVHHMRKLVSRVRGG